VTPLRVDCRQTSSGWNCSVTAGEDAGATQHEVRVAADVLARLAPADVEPTRLVRASFEFLLEREPRESILRSFDLEVIGRYFAGWEHEMRASGGLQ
jgi:hypothetical protein